MARLRTVKTALDLVEKRIWRSFVRLVKIKDGNVTINEEQLIGALRRALVLSYIFGKAYVIGEATRRKTYKLAEPNMQEIAILVGSNKELIAQLARLPVEDIVAELFAPSQEVLQFLETYAVQLAHIKDTVLLKKITSWVEETIRQGMSEKEAKAYLTERLVDFTDRRVQMIARTEATRAWNIGSIEESFTSEVVIGYRFTAVLDERTTRICRARHGMYIAKEDIATLSANTPPLHVNCRSVLEPVTRYDNRERKRVPEQLDTPQTRPYDRMVIQTVVSKAFSQWKGGI